jgi:hypothetical protein
MALLCSFFLWLYSPVQALAASMKLSVSLQLLGLAQSVGLLGRVISSSQGHHLYTNTENTNTQQTTQTLNIHAQPLCLLEGNCTFCKVAVDRLLPLCYM